MGKTEKKKKSKPYEIIPIVHITTGSEPIIYDGKITELPVWIIEEKK